jgi:hypothetical protein
VGTLFFVLFSTRPWELGRDNSSLVRKIRPSTPLILSSSTPAVFLFLCTTTPHEHSQGLSFPSGCTYTIGLLRSWEMNRHGISAAQPRLEAEWNNGDSGLQSPLKS